MKISEFLQNHFKNRWWFERNIKFVKYDDVELDLLPCPICKRAAELYITSQPDGNVSYIVAKVKCTNCRLQTEYRCVDGYYGDTETINDVINDWNARA